MKDIEWTVACSEADLPVRTARVVAHSGINVAVFRVEDGSLYAVEDRCPHRGAPLSRGLIYDNNKVACTDHGWSICLSDGKVDAPECGQIRTFPVKVEDGVVQVRIAGEGWGSERQ
jgi:nitrite reductase (NADH) small subunit